MDHVLRLNSIDLASNIARIRSGFQADAVTMNSRVSAAMGRAASLFGFSPQSDPRHISKFVADLTQGWSVRVDPAVHSEPEVGQASITALEFGARCALDTPSLR